MNISPKFEISFGASPYDGESNYVNSSLMNNQYFVLQNTNLLISGDYQIQIVKNPEWYIVPTERHWYSENSAPVMIPVPEKYFSKDNIKNLNSV